MDEYYRRMILVSFVGTLIIGTPLVYLLSPMIGRFGNSCDLWFPVIFMYAAVFASLFYLQFRILVSRLQAERPFLEA